MLFNFWLKLLARIKCQLHLSSDSDVANRNEKEIREGMHGVVAFGLTII